MKGTVVAHHANGGLFLNISNHPLIQVDVPCSGGRPVANEPGHAAVRSALQRVRPELALASMVDATDGYSGLVKVFLSPPNDPHARRRLFLKASLPSAERTVPSSFIDECHHTVWAAQHGLGAPLVLSAPEDGLLITRALRTDHDSSEDGQAPYRERYFRLLRRMHQSSGACRKETGRRSYYEGKWNRAWNVLPRVVQETSEAQIARALWKKTLSVVCQSPYAPVRCHGDFNPSNVRLTRDGDFAIDWATLKWDDPMYEVVYLSYHLKGDIQLLAKEFQLYGVTPLKDQQRAHDLFAMNHSLRFIRTFLPKQVKTPLAVLHARAWNFEWIQQDLAFLLLLPVPRLLTPPAEDLAARKNLEDA